MKPIPVHTGDIILCCRSHPSPFAQAFESPLQLLSSLGYCHTRTAALPGICSGVVESRLGRFCLYYVRTRYQVYGRRSSTGQGKKGLNEIVLR